MLLSALSCSAVVAPDPDAIAIDLWPGVPPGPAANVSGDERDTTGSDGARIAGRSVIRLGHVKTPQLHVYRPDPAKANGAAVAICPGGGFSILAWDLEGTEVARWFTGRGFLAAVVKYRVPTRDTGEAGRWIGPVMDTQRALTLLRHRAKGWGIDTQRVGVLGFSAGGAAAAIAATRAGERLYSPIDSADAAGCEASFAVLVYTGGLGDEGGGLRDFVRVTAKAPPTFIVHAADDRVTPLTSTALFNALQREKVPAELHVFSRGGHGYGMRETEVPVTRWGAPLEVWLKDRGLQR